MYNPTLRLLTILELLQVHGAMSGVDLAARLEVDVRTIRRYITMLQDMAIPIESERGRHGHYVLRPGYKLPPLMLNEDEALTVTLGLLITRQLSIHGDTIRVEGALAKILRVLPIEINHSAQAIAEVLTVDLSPARSVPNWATIVTASVASYRGEQLQLQYEAFNGNTTERAVDPYGIVYRAGFWYLVGYCHLRHDLRTFRMERVVSAERLAETSFDRPPEFDVLAYVEQSIANTPGVWTIEVQMETTLEHVRELIPRAMGLPEETQEGVILRVHVQNLDWLAYFLSQLDCSIRILRPPEARNAIQRLADNIRKLTTP